MIPSRRATGPAPSSLVVALILVLVLGLYFAVYLVPSEDEAGYLVLGAMATRGQISLYQDEIAAGRLPIPFYVLGASQLLTGPSLLSARLLSLVLGAASVGFVFVLADRLWGRLTATLAALFLATHAMIIGNFASATYDGYCALVFAAGLYALFVHRAPLVAMAVFSTFSLTRPNMAVVVPLVLGVLWWQARDWRERGWLLLIAGGPPLIFFASDVRHLKILMHVPGLERLVSRRFGFVSFVPLGADALMANRSVYKDIAWFVRRHVPWIAAGSGLTGAWLIGRWRDGQALWPSDSRVRFIVLLTVWTLSWQVIILHHYIKSVSSWVASFAPLPALLLGYVAGRLIESPQIPRALRWATVAGVAAIFLIGPTYSTHSAMPDPLPVQGTTLELLESTVAQLRAHVEPGARIFLFGNSVPTYLAGVNPYLEQIIHSWTLVSREDPNARRSGIWGRREIERWLSGEAPYALISQTRVAQFGATPGYRPLIDLIEQQLAAHYELVASLEAPPLWSYRLYSRRSRLGPEPPRSQPAHGPASHGHP